MSSNNGFTFCLDLGRISAAICEPINNILSYYYQGKCNDWSWPLQDYNYLGTPWDFTTFTTDTSPHLASIFRVLSNDAKLR